MLKIGQKCYSIVLSLGVMYFLWLRHWKVIPPKVFFCTCVTGTEQPSISAEQLPVTYVLWSNTNIQCGKNVCCGSYTIFLTVVGRGTGAINY